MLIWWWAHTRGREGPNKRTQNAMQIIKKPKGINGNRNAKATTQTLQYKLKNHNINAEATPQWKWASWQLHSAEALSDMF